MPIDACVKALWKRRSLASSSAHVALGLSSASRSAASSPAAAHRPRGLLLAEEIVQRRQQHADHRHHRHQHADAGLAVGQEQHPAATSGTAGIGHADPAEEANTSRDRLDAAGRLERG
jgi:hypothetical protein